MHRHAGENRHPDCLNSWIPGRASYRPFARNDDKRLIFYSTAFSRRTAVENDVEEQRCPYNAAGTRCFREAVVRRARPRSIGLIRNRNRPLQRIKTPVRSLPAQCILGRGAECRGARGETLPALRSCACPPPAKYSSLG